MFKKLIKLYNQAKDDLDTDSGFTTNFSDWLYDKFKPKEQVED